MTPLAPRSLRTICCTPTDSPTSECSKPWCTRYAMARSLNSDANTSCSAARRSRSPRTLRNVACWPANEASGRSSAVADDRTATEMPRPASSACQAATHFLAQASRQRRGQDRLPDLGARARQGGQIGHIESMQCVLDTPIEAVLAQEIPVRVHGGRIAVRHRDAKPRERAQHLTERRVLAANELYVGAAEFPERHYVGMHPLCCLCARVAETRFYVTPIVAGPVPRRYHANPRRKRAARCPA